MRKLDYPRLNSQTLKSFDCRFRGAVSSLNKSSSNDILETTATLLPVLPTTLDQWSLTRQRRVKQPRALTWFCPEPRRRLEPWSLLEYLQAVSERSALYEKYHLTVDRAKAEALLEQYHLKF